jgi:hypothetical protein
MTLLPSMSSDGAVPQDRFMHLGVSPCRSRKPVNFPRSVAFSLLIPLCETARLQRAAFGDECATADPARKQAVIYHCSCSLEETRACPLMLSSWDRCLRGFQQISWHDPETGVVARSAAEEGERRRKKKRRLPFSPPRSGEQRSP